MFLAKKTLSRRTVLRGMGTTLALPLSDAMVPAGARAQAAAKANTRLVCIEMVHGSAGATAFGRDRNLWRLRRAVADSI